METSRKLSGGINWGAPALPYCGMEIIWAVRREMARMVEDVLARRTRA